MKTYNINEIFYSLQGEGSLVGTPVIFIRFSGCNKVCSFCDTKHQKYKQMTINKILKAVKKQGDCRKVIFTGGEPLLQLDPELCIKLKEEGYFLGIETNGTILNKTVSYIDHLTVSPKINLTSIDEWNLREGTDLKIIVNENTTQEFLNKIYFLSNFDNYYLQPSFSKISSETKMNTKIAIDFLKSNQNNAIWKLSLQTQKLIKIK